VRRKGGRWQRVTAVALLVWLALSPIALAEEEHPDLGYFTVLDAEGKVLLRTCHRLHVGDQFMDAQGRVHVVVTVEGDAAHARPVDSWRLDDIGPAAWGGQWGPGLTTVVDPVASSPLSVAIYHTHTDESFVPSEGRASVEGKGGVVRVGCALTEQLERLGVSVHHEDTTHLPHDALAYDRSRRTAVALLKRRPAAIFDVHRDTAPPEDVTAEVDGEEVARILLVVGRQNPNVRANLGFARRLKEEVDRRYPGLMRGILLASGKYNQDLHPRLLILEVGSHQVSRSQAERAARLLAGVLPDTLAAVAPGARAESRGAWSAVIWLLVVTAVAVFGFLWITEGSWEAAWRRLRSFLRREAGLGAGERREEGRR